MGITEMTKLWEQLERFPFKLQRYAVQSVQRVADFLFFQPCCLSILGEEHSGTSLFFRYGIVLETRWLERQSLSIELLYGIAESLLDTWSLEALFMENCWVFFFFQNAKSESVEEFAMEM